MSRSELPASVRAFLWFRVCFNARFYYPVLAVFFVDLGLTLDRYALLNVAWAASIVLFELPLGAVADRIGRRPLVIGAAVLMVVEMAVLGFAPLGNVDLLFAVFLVNRVLSGLAEAAASGADEALAYDALCAAGRQSEWPRVLSSLQARMSAAFVLHMVIGAAVYDPKVVNGFGALLGLSWGLGQTVTARFPVYLTLLLSFGAVAAALRMHDPEEADAQDDAQGWMAGVRGTVATGRWIVGVPYVLALIVFALVLDSVARLFLTIGSTWYRMIGIPAAIFGFLGAAFAGLGMLSPPVARRLVERTTPRTGFAVVALLTLAAFTGIALVDTTVAIVFMIPLGLGFNLLHFLGSHYLNAATSSRRRATVLSFRSLAGNVAYGAVGWLYAVLLRGLGGTGAPPEPGSPQEMDLLARTLPWIPIALAALVVPLFVWAARIPRMRAREEGSDSGA